MAKATQVRIKRHVLRMVRSIAGDIQRQTGENISDSDAVLYLIQQVRPELIDQFPDENGDDNGNGEDAT